MLAATPPPGSQPGKFKIVFSSAAAESEWNSFASKHPDAAREAFNRLSTNPLMRQPGRQFPLKGQANKPFWELEITAADRIYYAVCLKTLSVIVAVRSDTHTGAEVSKLIKARVGAIKRLVRDIK